MIFWIDIDDLMFHLLHHGRPSGIQRVVFEIGAALRALYGNNVQFVHRGSNPADPRDFRTLDWTMVEAAFRHIMGNAGSSSASTAKSVPVTPQATGDIASNAALSTFFESESRVLSELGDLTKILGRMGLDAVRDRVTKRRSQTPRVEFAEGTKLADAASPGDVFLTLGAPWHHRHYIHTIRWMRDDLRMRFGLLMHDLVPIRCPEWCDRGIITTFKSWHQAILPLADVIFANSQATARDVESYLKEQGIDTPVQAIPLGTGFGLAETATASEALVDEPYALFVSTIEARKNHALLFRVWRQLLEDMPAEKVPTLVFAGREGWLVSDLMQQLENSRWLNGKIRFIQNPTDGELRRLYADCSFTLFPSFFEGWGLPVTESLSMGRPCIASNTTSIPEAGGSLGRYFNPCSLKEAYTVIRQTIEDPEGLAAWTQQVRTEFKPRPWTESAKTILAAFEPV
ncbi:glycosyltransferase family 4 protein [Gluconobacter roseus]|uniref:glycosyltransferase family 4 protein n=1 Tax=Gluconobacter roseus TaxID=586239 RepID=UPI0038D0A954